MHAAEAHELAVLESRHKPEHPLLLGIGELGLAAHQVAGFAIQILGAQLQDSPRPPARARIREAHGLERTEAQGFRSALGQSFNRHASLKMNFFLEVAAMYFLRTREGVIKPIIFFPRHGAVKIIPSRFPFFLAIARSPEDHGHIKGMGPHDRGDSVVKIAVLHADLCPERGRKVFRGQRARRNDHISKAIKHRIVKPVYLPLLKADSRFCQDFICNPA